MDEPMMEREIRPPVPQEPIHETETSVSYLGVQLPKALDRSSPFIPQREKYADFINDPYLALPMQKNVAVAFMQGQPILIEGGTSIGKTTGVRKMASELGYEVHYANLNGRTDVEDLMGKYIPNPDKKSADDPEYIFADGKVTSGLRQEEGKVKVIILDEINAADPNVLIRLHEVLDALERGESVILSEDASEAVAVSKETTKVVGLMNPPGKGYFGREPFDPAQLRRWVYYKAPTELPKETFKTSTIAMFGLAPTTAPVEDSMYLPSREMVLLPEQLAEIPGIVDILTKYQEFHDGAKQLVKERKVGADQPQLFTFDDRMEPKRVRDFVLSFFNGDINATFQQALRYYYANKVESAEDKEKLEALIGLVEYQPPVQVSARRGLDREPQTPLVGFTPLTTEAETETPTPLIPPEVGAILEASERGRVEQRAWSEVLGREVEIKPLPSVVTPEVQRKLEAMGLELRFIPKLDLGRKEDIKPVTRRTGVLRTGEEVVTAAEENYLTQLEAKYPKWKRYEGLTEDEKGDHSVSRNLEEWYWEQVKLGGINFPQLPGQWVAVEKMPKPSYGEKYADSKITRDMGFEDRFNISWNDADAAITRLKPNILREAGIVSTSGADVRMLEAVEWNLLANREGWGKTDTYEWVNTDGRGSGGSGRVVVGDSGYGGAADARWYRPDHRHDYLGFRLAVVLQP